ncbi:MAG: hypothetical protein KatS3mg036_0503 [Ignavibacterium sp.]|uniref:hypothetical protein n=1 Tax=Ignavibacterium sp. TaxID=2651167 RepID=UPI0021DD3D0F|nr:hypothetical protein [Ignavibacterium sp.]BDQ01949.1 MAG: hypothetical protein KatS3mg037_0524 [Ignavibacterium sp.]GIV45685.1 MAG: hypothetical protein KatS3mg036_0503 [Ignavibacterium sp.]
MAIASNNPELIIDVKYNVNQASSEYSRFTKRVEQQALRHEKQLLNINQNTQSKLYQHLQQSNQRIVSEINSLNKKIERITEAENQKAISRSKAYYSRQLGETKNWVNNMESSLGRLKSLFLTYLGAKTFGAITTAFNSALENLDALKKEAFQLGLTFQDLYATVFQNALSGVDTDTSVRILNNIKQMLDEAISDPKLSKKLKQYGIDLNSSLLEAYETLKKYVRATGDASILGARLAGELRKVAYINDEQLESSKQLLRRIGISEKEIQYIERYNDAITTLKATVQLIVGKIFAQSGDKIAAVIENISDKIANLDTEKIADLFEFMLDSTNKVAKNLRTISQLLATIDRLSAFVASISNIKNAIDLTDIKAGILELDDIIRQSTQDLELLGQSGDLDTRTISAIEERILILEKTQEQLKKASRIEQKGLFGKNNSLESIALQFEKLKVKITDIIKPLTELPQKFEALGKSGSVIESIFGKALGSISKLFAGIFSGSSKAIKFISELTGIGKAFGAIFKFIGKISVYLTVLFMIYDFFDALFTYFKETDNWLDRLWKTVKAFGYSLAKLVADIIDGIVQIASFGKLDLQIGKRVREFFGLDEENKVVIPIYNPVQHPQYFGGKKNKNITYSPEQDENTKKIIEQFKNLANLKEETQKYIHTLENLKRQYSDQPYVLREINKQLIEQRELLADINQESLRLKPIAKGFDLPQNLGEPLINKARSFKVVQFDDTSLYGGIKAAGSELTALRNKLDVLKSFKDLFDSASDEAKALSQQIKRLSDEIDEIDNSPINELIQKFQQEFLPLMSEAINFINTLIDANLERLNNELDVMQRRIELEQEYWDTVLSNLEEAGAKGTAYYIKQESEKKRAIAKLTSEEIQLKAKVWEAEKSARISGAIMTAAQASLSAWTIIPPNPPLSLALTTLIAGTLATQLASINSQQNPYLIKKNLGGWIEGTGYTDSVPALLTPGEYVVNRQAAKENALLLETINSGRKVQASNTVVVNLNFDGNLIAEDSWVEDSLIPKINKAILKGYQLGLN